ncbi:hypothetical protein [Azospirillum cavernae]|uniref:hypothetical protein n=1 Tax=Azospirillum cavernae TaxID=2320860 RepID=UPI0011C43596|nr:hypothetical protein [Azospirillum cavernae]
MILPRLGKQWESNGKADDKKSLFSAIAESQLRTLKSEEIRHCSAKTCPLITVLSSVQIRPGLPVFQWVRSGVFWKSARWDSNGKATPLF